MTSSDSLNSFDTDVIIAGAGPTGLVCWQICSESMGLTSFCSRPAPDLIDYPRGVGIDDDPFRTVQAMDPLMKSSCLPFRTTSCGLSTAKATSS